MLVGYSDDLFVSNNVVCEKMNTDIALYAPYYGVNNRMCYTIPTSRTKIDCHAKPRDHERRLCKCVDKSKKNGINKRIEPEECSLIYACFFYSFNKSLVAFYGSSDMFHYIQRWFQRKYC